MSANTTPIYTLTPNIGFTKIVATSAQIKSDGTSAGSAGADIMYKAYTAGSFGSYIEKIIFTPVSQTSQTTTPCILRVYISTVSAPGATNGGANPDTFLLTECAASGTITAASTSAVSLQYEIMLNCPLASGYYIHVSQSVAQANGNMWEAVVHGQDY